MNITAKTVARCIAIIALSGTSTLAQDSSHDYDSAFAAMRQASKELRGDLDRKSLDRFIKAQSAWLSFCEREAGLAAEMASMGGKWDSSIYNARRTELTKLRTAEIQGLTRQREQIRARFEK